MVRIHCVGERILCSLEKRGGVPFAGAPGDGEVNAALGEGLGETDPMLAPLLSAMTSGMAPAGRPARGPARKRTPVRHVYQTDARREPKGYLFAQDDAFNLHAARRRGRRGPCPGQDGANYPDHSVGDAFAMSGSLTRPSKGCLIIPAAGLQR